MGLRPLMVAAREVFSNLDIPWALVGGLAVGVRAAPRFTRDVDVAVSVAGDAAVEKVVFAFVSRGWRTGAVLEHGPTHRLATVRLLPPGGDEGTPLLDCLFSSCGIEPDIASQAEVLEILPGLSLPVARTGHLLAMKVLAMEDRSRPQDRDDIRALLEHAGQVDRDLATTALGHIVTLGYHRGRDLHRIWVELIRDS